MTASIPVHTWADALEKGFEREGVSIVDRVAVFAQTLSTQDTARRMAAGKPGVLVVTAHQSEGRGRLGRAWADDPDHSLAMTLSLSTRDHTPAFLALAAGVALADACASILPRDSLGLKWPNDLVERTTGRKLAGILVEVSGPLALVGIGLNVSHTHAALDDAGLTAATSLRALGATADRVTLAVRVVSRLDHALRQAEADLAAAWRRRDTLTGTHQLFTYDGKHYQGVVEAIDPTLTLVVRTGDGIHRLPALATSVSTHES